jgi:hypothetical protein
MCIVLPKALHKLLADRANNNGRKPNPPTAMGCFTNPRFPNVILISQNIRGYSSETSSSKKDHIVWILNTFSETPTILFTQEMWSDNNTNLAIDNTLCFSHGAKSNNRTKGGIGIILSPLVVQAWKLSDQPDPICPETLAGSSQVMALECHFHDNANKTNKLFVILTYLPCSSHKNNEYEATLAEVDKIMRKCPVDATPIIGSDFNASICTANTTEDLFNSPVGHNGNAHKNDSGDKLRDFMLHHGLCSIVTFFEKQCHITWSFNGDGARSYQIDHILAKREELKRFTDCDTIGAGVESNHTAVAAIMRLAKFIPKKWRCGPSQAKQQGDQTETERSKQVPVDWEAIRLNKESVDKFNDELNGLINEELRHIDAKWEPEMDCPHKRLSKAIKKTATPTVAPSNGKKKIPPWFEMSKATIMRANKNRDGAHLV